MAWALWAAAQGPTLSEGDSRDDGNAEDAALWGNQKFKVEAYLPIIDKLCSVLSHRVEAYKNVHLLFSSLVEFTTVNDDDISKSAAIFQKIYSEDIEPEFITEIIHFKNFVGQFDEFRNKHDTLEASDIYALVLKNGLTSSFPSVEIALRIYLCLMITNWSEKFLQTETYKESTQVSNDTRTT